RPARRPVGGETKARPLRHARRAGAEVGRSSRRKEAPSELPRQSMTLVSPAATAFVALGSNLGDSRALVLLAMDRLASFSSIPLLRSSLWQSTPVDCPPGSSLFVNAVAGLRPLPGETPKSLLAKLTALEMDFGRQPKQSLNEARPLDLDLIA